MDKNFKKMYTSLAQYENQIHEQNQKRIRIGIKCILIIPLIFLSLMFLTESSKEIFLVLWILSLFMLAIYLILVEYSDFKLQEKLNEIRGETDAEIKPLIPKDIIKVEATLVKTIKKIDQNINSKEELKPYTNDNINLETSTEKLLGGDSSEKHI